MVMAELVRSYTYELVMLALKYLLSNISTSQSGPSRSRSEEEQALTLLISGNLRGAVFGIGLPPFLCTLGAPKDRGKRASQGAHACYIVRLKEVVGQEGES